MLIKPLFLIVLLSSFNAFSGVTSPYEVCPAISTDAQNIITGLLTLKDQIKKSPECQAVSEKIKNVGDAVTDENWSKFRKRIKGNTTVVLEDEELVELEALSNQIGSTLMETMDLLNGAAGHCIPPEQSASTLSTIAGITRELSTLMGKTTGPYGIAVSLGGNMISQILQGVDQYFSNKNIYNFKDKEEEFLFMNQFCSFTESQKDVSDFLGLDKRKNELITLSKYLKIKLRDLKENCPECAAYSLTWNYKLKMDKIIKRIKDDINIVNNSDSPIDTRTYSNCTEISRAVHTSESDLKQLFSLLENYKNPAMTTSDKEIISQFVQAGKTLPTIFPTMEKCWGMNNEEKSNISRKFNDFIRDDVLHLSKTIFEQQLKTFRFIADKKYKKPLGDYTARTVSRLVWIEKYAREIDSKLADPNRKMDLANIRELQADLKNRIIENILPQYLTFLGERSSKTASKFVSEYQTLRTNNWAKKRSVKKYGPRRKPFKKRIIKTNSKNINEFLTNLKSSKSSDPRIFLSKFRNVITPLKMILDQGHNSKRYCNYLLYITSFYGEAATVCDENEIKMSKIYSKLKPYNNEFNQLQNFEQWSELNLKIQSSRVRDLAQHIEKWSNLGSSRWEKRKTINDQTPRSTLENITEAESSWNNLVNKWETK